MLQSRSSNHFGNSLNEWPLSTDSTGTLPILVLPDTSKVVKIILDLFYQFPILDPAPNFLTISEVLHLLPAYGLPFPSASSDLWRCLSLAAPEDPISAITLAASFGVEVACVAVSPDSLRRAITHISPAQADAMGPVYLKRIFDLHSTRVSVFRRLLSDSPIGHRVLTNSCSDAGQFAHSLAWKATVADILVADNEDYMSTDELKGAFVPVIDNATCTICKDNARALLNRIISDWQATKDVV